MRLSDIFGESIFDDPQFINWQPSREQDGPIELIVKLRNELHKKKTNRDHAKSIRAKLKDKAKAANPGEFPSQHDTEPGTYRAPHRTAFRGRGFEG